MGTTDDRIALETHIGDLRRQLADSQGQLSPDAKVAALAAVVQAEALMLMADTMRSAVQTVVHDGRGLMSRRDRR